MTSLNIPLKGSWQNPAWCQRDDGLWLSVTRWVSGYNREPSEVYIFPLADPSKLTRVAGNSCSQPGSCWHPDAGIIMSRTATDDSHDEIWCWTPDGILQTLTSHASHMAYEPSWSPDGGRFVFERHLIDQEDHGQIVIGILGGNDLIGEGGEFVITAEAADCRQPNWSPDGRWIVYQENLNGRWVLRLYEVATGNIASFQLDGDATDATFSPDSKYLIYSGQYKDMDGCLLSVPITGGSAGYVAGAKGEYHGAPSWGPNGLIACEWGLGDPDSSGKPTKIVLVKAPGGK